MEEIVAFELRTLFLTPFFITFEIHSDPKLFEEVTDDLYRWTRTGREGVACC